MTTRRRLTAEILQLFANSMGGMLIGFIGTILVTRALGPEDRGIYAWLLTISSLAVSAALLTQYNVSRKLGAEGDDTESDWPRLLGSLVTLNAAGTLVALPLLAWALFQPVGQSHTGLLLLSMCAVPFMSMASVIGAFIHLRRNTAATLLSTYVPRILIVALTVLAWSLNELTLANAIFLNTFIAIIGILVFHAWLNIPLRRWRFDASLLRRVSRFLGAGWLAGLALFAMPKLPLLLLPNYASLQDIGFFSLATALLDISLMIPAAATSVLISHFTRSQGSSNKWQILYALTALVICMAIGGYVVAPYVVPFLFGAEFSAAIAPFRLLLLALLLQAPLVVLSGSVTAKGHSLAVVVPVVIGLAAALAASLLLLPSYGIWGACWAIIIGYLTQVLVLTAFIYTRR